MADNRKLCECGCGEYTLIATRTYGRLGVKKGEPYRFIHGHNARLPKTREWMASLVGRALEGEEHPRWAGEEVGRFGRHVRIWKTKERTHICQECGKTGRTHFASLTNHEYTDNPDDYAELCPGCHKLFDEGKITLATR